MIQDAKEIQKKNPEISFKTLSNPPHAPPIAPQINPQIFFVFSVKMMPVANKLKATMIEIVKLVQITSLDGNAPVKLMEATPYVRVPAIIKQAPATSIF